MECTSNGMQSSILNAHPYSMFSFPGPVLGPLDGLVQKILGQAQLPVGWHWVFLLVHVQMGSRSLAKL